MTPQRAEGLCPGVEFKRITFGEDQTSRSSQLCSVLLILDSEGLTVECLRTVSSLSAMHFGFTVSTVQGAATTAVAHVERRVISVDMGWTIGAMRLFVS